MRLRLPWSRGEPEKRQAVPFTDAVVAALQAQASGQAVGDASAIAALEAVVALYSRAFAAATVEPAEIRPLLSPPLLSLLARNLIRRGEDVHQIIVERGRVRLQPIGSWDVRGGPDPSTWWYRCDRFGPSGNLTELVRGAAVLHCRYAVDSARPWHGIGPLGWARSTGTLAANLETRLGEEAGARVGSFLPLPKDDQEVLAQIEANIGQNRGGMLTVKTAAGGWEEGKAGAPTHDFVTKRYGANPPAALATLRSDASVAVLEACGVPVALMGGSDGTAMRAAWTRFLAGSVEPLLETVRVEVETKLEQDVTFDLSPLAADLTMRAQALERMVKAGIALAEARRLSGLLGGG